MACCAVWTRPVRRSLEDSFQKYAGRVEASRKEATAYHLSGTPEPDGYLDLTTLMVPAAEPESKGQGIRCDGNGACCAPP